MKMFKLGIGTNTNKLFHSTELDYKHAPKTVTFTAKLSSSPLFCHRVFLNCYSIITFLQDDTVTVNFFLNHEFTVLGFSHCCG